MEKYKGVYKRKIEKYREGIKKAGGDVGYWDSIVIMIENDLEGWDFCLHDANMECHTSDELIKRMVDAKWWKGNPVQRRAIEERADRIYPDLYTKLRKAFKDYLKR